MGYLFRMSSPDSGDPVTKVNSPLESMISRAETPATVTLDRWKDLIALFEEIRAVIMLLNMKALAGVSGL